MTAVRIDAEAAALRRQLGPVPWFVLEELVLASDATGAVETGVRAVARTLSLNKDTVARAIARLRAEGLVVAKPQIHRGGRFGATRYQVAPAAGVQRVGEDETDLDPVPRRSRPSLRPPRETAQLSLIDQALDTEPDDSRLLGPSVPKQVDALAPGVRPGGTGRRRDATGTRGTSGMAAGRC